MSGTHGSQPTERPKASDLPEAPAPEGRGAARVVEGASPTQGEERVGLRALAAHLEALGVRAIAERWPGFTAEDGRIIAAAASELATFEEALAQGMREAFAIGREHREREALLNRLNEEIAIATGRLAREAWGARRREPDG